MEKDQKDTKAKKEKPFISKETQNEIMSFFLKTSIPRILESREVKNS